jgi:hypothetical protein
VFRGSLPSASCGPGQGTRGETTEYREYPEGSAATTTTLRATPSCHPKPSWTAAGSVAPRRFRITHSLRQPSHHQGKTGVADQGSAPTALPPHSKTATTLRATPPATQNRPGLRREAQRHAAFGPPTTSANHHTSAEKRCRRSALPPHSKIAAFSRNALVPIKPSWSV